MANTRSQSGPELNAGLHFLAGPSGSSLACSDSGRSLGPQVATPADGAETGSGSVPDSGAGSSSGSGSGSGFDSGHSKLDVDGKS